MNEMQNPNTQEQKTKEKREPLLFTEIKRRAAATLCVSLYNRIVNVANATRKSFAGAMRMLLYMGLDEYERNQKAGIDTTVKRKQHKAKQDAEAQALAARKAQSKQRKGKDTAQAVTPLLFGTKED